MPDDLASYLASNYLCADASKSKPSKSKKRKRKQDFGLVIADDDESGWGTRQENHDQDEATAAAVAGTSAEFRKSKKSNWKTLAGVKKSETSPDAAAAAADAIIASVAEEAKAAQKPDDESPTVQDVDMGDGPNIQRMTDGTLSGLQSAASLAAQTKKQRQHDLKQWEREKAATTASTDEPDDPGYRDAMGRRVDASLQREAANLAIADRDEKERKKLQLLKGGIQVEQARLRREQLASAKSITLARKADDDSMNKELKEKERWNDPMAQFLTEKKSQPATVGGTGKRRARPIYTGPAPPNRYGIRPGYRWDGVDRGNGLEAERFKEFNRKERNKGLEYAWQMDE